MSKVTDPSTKKRKRETLPDEVEIDISAPEPPSKKALRRAKRGKSATAPILSPVADLVTEYFESDAAQAIGPGIAKRSEHGIWIGNLPWTVTRDSLLEFFTEKGGIAGKDVVRLHMPASAETGDKRVKQKVQNKGFAYVDFSNAEVLEKALTLSETLVGGRKVLIKNAKSFEGRPDKKSAADDAKADKGAAQTKAERPVSKRIFVGNLSFDVSKEDLETHFAQAGEVEDVHMATFEDSGKCKGFAWVRFVETQGAEAAVKGFIFKKTEEYEVEHEDEQAIDGASDDSGESEGNPFSSAVAPLPEDDGIKSGSEDTYPKADHARPVKTAKKKANQKARQKWFINRLHGRPLRCEFAEDSVTRYKKRFGADRKPGEMQHNARASSEYETSARRDMPPLSKTPPGRRDGGEGLDDEVKALAGEAAKARGRNNEEEKERRRAVRSKKHMDARGVKPGRALAGATRASVAIVAGAGKKTTFE